MLLLTEAKRTVFKPEGWGVNPLPWGMSLVEFVAGDCCESKEQRSAQ